MSAPLRVLHLHSGNLYGGIETFLVALARHRALCPELEPHFAPCYQGRLSDELRSLGASVHLLGPARLSRPWTVLSARRRLAEVVRGERMDMLVAHGSWPYCVLGLGAERPVVYFAHGLTSAGNVLDWIARHRPPAALLCNSQFMETHGAALFPAVPRTVVYCPLALEGPVPRETAAEPVTIVQVSRIEPLKGHELHLQALAMLKGTPGWRCWMVGGPQRPTEQHLFSRLQSLATELGIADRVSFLGQRSDIPAVLAKADIYCQPNVGPEGFGLTFVEALTAALPVVATAMGGALEIVDPSCGVLVSPHPEPLAAALARLISDRALRINLGRAGVARVQALCEPRLNLERLHRSLRALQMNHA